jgi:chemotaxis protein MotB
MPPIVARVVKPVIVLEGRNRLTTYTHGGLRMARMAQISKFIGMAVVGFALTGCVSQEKYNALKLDRDGLAEQLATAQKDASTARAEADTAKNNLAQILAQGGNLQGLVTNLQQQVANLQAQNDELNRKYAEAMARGPGQSPLPKPLNDELQAFANQNPDLVDFDSARGIVKFKSDVTFASGSAEVTPKAKEAIQRFAQILNSQTARGYELLVAGHTDNTRVANNNTIKAGHLDNWYLSAHRAIAVSAELRNHNVNPQRLGAVGYADQRPAASNGTSQGMAQNRRVEVLILPTTVRAGAPVASSGNNGRSGETRKAPTPNKDTRSVGTETGPVLNK